MRSASVNDQPRLFVGRERELATLQQALATARNQDRPILLIAGEPGVGKTHLLLEASAVARTQGWRVLVGNAYGSEGMPPYLPFIEALQDYTRSCPPEELKAQLGEGVSDVALLLPELRRFLPDLRSIATNDPAADRYRFFEGVASFVEAIALSSPAGLLLCLEDLHWADDSTLLLLEHLARRSWSAPIVVLGTYRDTELHTSRSLARTLEQLVRQRQSQHIDLERLDQDKVASMLARLAQAEPPTALTEAVFNETEGNPFFVREVFEYLTGEGRLFDAAGSWRSDLEIGETEVPRNVRLVIGRRLEMLSAECRRVLGIASVIGRTFDYEVLRAVSELDENDLLDALDEARRMHMLASETGAALSLNHELVRQTLLSDLTTPRRQRLHHQIAKSLETLHESNLEPYLAEIAAHYRAAPASNFERAIEYSVRAAEASCSVYAWEEAASTYQGALLAQELSGRQDDSLHCDLLLALGEALVAAGGQDRFLKDVGPKALALAEALDDNRRAFAACRIALGAGTGPVPQYWLDRAERCVGDAPEARIELNGFKAIRSLHDGQFQETRKLLLEALNLARKISNPGAELRITSFLLRFGVLAADEERQLFEETRKLPRKFNGTADQANIVLEAIMTHLQWGERALAEVERRELALLAAHTRYDMALTTSAAAEALAAMLDGRLREGFNAIIGAGLGTFPHVWRGRLANWLGDTTALEAELAWTAGLNSYLGLAFRANFLAQSGRLNEARDTLARMPDLPPEPSQPAANYGMMSLLLEAAVLSGDSKSAPVLLELLSGDDRSLAKPYFVLVPRHLAGAAAILGEFDRARTGYFDAIDFCERIGYRPELALSRLDLAHLLLRHYPRERAEALRHLELAIEEFDAMEMQPSLDRALRLRGRRRLSKESPPAFPAGLTEREVEVLRLIAAGKSNQQIAEELVISVNTVARHVTSILDKIGAVSRGEAAAFAHSHELVNDRPQPPLNA